mmetsp:Transcript_472/g.1442  ORF Transcript_472/g.1442 Transcript_472/m.1442 type:complete len:91 (+) Transcript_472:213-485(+)
MATLVHWLRQVIGLSLGIAWGLLGIRGYTGFILYVLLSISTVPAICSNRLSLEGKRLGEVMSFEMAKEGFLPAFALFMVTWIMTYTAVHA